MTKLRKKRRKTSQNQNTPNSPVEQKTPTENSFMWAAQASAQCQAHRRGLCPLGLEQKRPLIGHSLGKELKRESALCPGRIPGPSRIMGIPWGSWSEPCLWTQASLVSRASSTMTLNSWFHFLCLVSLPIHWGQCYLSHSPVMRTEWKTKTKQNKKTVVKHPARCWFQ